MKAKTTFWALTVCLAAAGCDDNTSSGDLIVLDATPDSMALVGGADAMGGVDVAADMARAAAAPSPNDAPSFRRPDAPDLGVVPLPFEPPSLGCGPVEEPDELAEPRHDETLPWLEGEAGAIGTRFQVLGEQRISRVLFVGDASLLDVPSGDEGGDQDLFATLRGRVTRGVAALTDLTAPEPGFGQHNWYRPADDAMLVRENERRHDFSVCAHPGAGWAHLYAAVHTVPDSGTQGLYPGCLDRVEGDGGALLVVVSFAGYGPSAYAADKAAISAMGHPEPDDGAGLDRLGVFAAEALGALRARFTEDEVLGAGGVRPARFDDVIILVLEHISWRAGADRCGACDIDPRDQGFTTLLTAVNETLVAQAGRETFDVVLADAESRSHGAACLDRQGERGVAGCGTVPMPAEGEPDPLVTGGRFAPDMARHWEGCCWTRGAGCDLPDTDGHLFLGERILRAISGLMAAR